MNKKNVSVVIACYNRKNILRKILPSYLKQKHLLEIILVDDASSDGTQKYLKNISKKNKLIKYIRNDFRKGTCETKNVGIKASKGEYIFIGEDDIELEENHLDILLKDLNKNNADVISGRRIWLKTGEKKKEAKSKRDTIYSSPVDYKMILTNCETNIDKDEEVFILDACMLVKRKVFEKVLFDTSLFKDSVAWRNETDFQLSVAENGYKQIFCPHTYCFHEPKNKPKIKDIFKMLKYDYFVIINNYKFAKKHKSFINIKFGIKNYIFYSVKFSVWRIIHRYLSPLFKKLNNQFV